MENALISTLICTYNAESFISKTLDSVINQDYQNQEILIWDDCSNDNTLEVLYAYQKKDKRIHIFSESKKLWSFWWLNYLLEKAKWEYIAIQDHDDIRHSEKLRRQISFLKEHKYYLWCWTGTLMYYWKSRVGFLSIMEHWKKKNPYVFAHTSMVYRNLWYRYDTSVEFLCDLFFLRYILCKNKPLLGIIPLPLTLHYCKETGWNYSEQWFKFNFKNIKRFFDIYWFNLYIIFLLIYLSLLNLLPYKIRNRIDSWLLFNIKWAKTKVILEKNTYLKQMLSYY